MTKLQQNKLDRGTHVLIPKWEVLLKYVALAGIIVYIYNFGSKDAIDAGKMLDSIKQKEAVVSHVEVKNEIHMSLQELQNAFVTRREYEQTLTILGSINENLEEINKKLDD